SIVSKDIPIKKQFTSDKGKLHILKYLGENFYFSLITFTTIGYGDIKPVGWLIQAIAGIEGLLGALLMSLFLVTAAKKVLW
ncbi:MAG: potassium channel family protein, partial [Spirochaetales bacterium]|nr:potassium channel family protein [Spirochaetales bacterium]